MSVLVCVLLASNGALFRCWLTVFINPQGQSRTYSGNTTYRRKLTSSVIRSKYFYNCDIRSNGKPNINFWIERSSSIVNTSSIYRYPILSFLCSSCYCVFVAFQSLCACLRAVCLSRPHFHWSSVPRMVSSLFLSAALASRTFIPMFDDERDDTCVNILQQIFSKKTKTNDDNFSPKDRILFDYDFRTARIAFVQCVC